MKLFKNQNILNIYLTCMIYYILIYNYFNILKINVQKDTQ